MPGLQWRGNYCNACAVWKKNHRGEERPLVRNLPDSCPLQFFCGHSASDHIQDLLTRPKPKRALPERELTPPPPKHVKKVQHERKKARAEWQATDEAEVGTSSPTTSTPCEPAEVRGGAHQKPRKCTYCDKEYASPTKH